MSKEQKLFIYGNTYTKFKFLTLMGFKAGEGYWAVYYNIVLFVGLTTLGALMDFDCLVH